MRSPLLATTLVLAMMTAACTDTTGGSVPGASSSVSVSGKNANEIALEREVMSLQQQTKNIIVRNTVEGAVVGALAGCALAVMLGGDEQDCARGAVVGGVAGGVGGNAVGRAAAEKNEELVKQDAILANLKGINAKLGSVQGRLSTVLAAQKTELASLKRQLDGDQISKSAYDARVKSINANRTAVSSGLQAAETGVARSRTELASVEKEGGRAMPALQTAAQSTESRLKALRGTISLIGTN
ncbi:MAG: hypothetical protein CFE34_15900 [Rhodobacteraceae bacterium PARR1]|nr:MAG: hypothetical protein CFE34_15900 [Rhodobacteraceae bacterium PARR1]